MPLFRDNCVLLWIAACLLLPALGFAQNKKDLEEKRKKLIRDIEITDKLLRKTTKSKETTYDRFVTLQSQIERRESLIQTLSEEIAESEENIVRTRVVIASLSRDVQAMKEDYGRIVRNAYRQKELSNPLLYIFSAEDLNQAFRRWLFLRKYDRYRKNQADAIAFTQSMLSKKISALEETQRKKESLLVSMQGQKVTLSSELVDKEKLLKVLEKDEGRLREDLQHKQVAHEALNQAIERVIQEEIRKKVEEARRPKPASSPPVASTPAATPSTPAPKTKSNPDQTEELADVPDDASSLAFKQNRGRLPWPVENGFISKAFGRQKHPTLRNIEITNNGIDIRTDESAVVRAIYDGKVAGVQFIPGHDYTVILQHGNYYTVYSNLSETSLTKGSRVSARQAIGKVSTNLISGSSELHFELWYQKQRLNPTSWINK
ncbi:MAG: peptidoglycan DD-metalloendopeptidase family protein [Saprospiraceae bacterium]|nr:peptidoglycan DD-metalloendopeptidase family protein [Saprospiraceae bacterium]